MKNVILAIFIGAITLSTASALTTQGCNSTQRNDLQEMADYVNNHWNAFENYIDRHYGINLKSCIKNRFKKNGKIVCENSCSSGVNGYAYYLSKKAHFCPSFLNRVGRLSKKVNRRGCYFALAAHEFGHTCLRGHGSVEDIDDGAFDWWASTHDLVDIDLRDCGMD
ncbi:MAG: hypothetical protein ISR65_18150 [Bacteriovoracaceae bacterium]|nr:hypothetical protein [Bacteriovoracaceae bacterium]